MGDTGMTICVLVIRIIIALAFVALNLVWLFPVMNNSKKDEPPIEKLSCFLPNKNNLRYLDSSEIDCDSKGEEFSEKGAYETFNFKMKQIHKYSKGLIAIFFIQAGLVVLFVLIFIICLFCQIDALVIFSYIYLILEILCYT